MIRHVFLAAALLVACVLGVGATERPVATVSLTERASIERTDLDAQIALFEAQLGRTLSRDERVEVLEAMVNDILLLQAAARAGIAATGEDVQNYLNAQKLALNQTLGRQLTDQQFVEQVEQQTGEPFARFVENVTNEVRKLAYVRRDQADLFATAPEPTEQEILAVYSSRSASFTNPAMVSFRHVYADIRSATDEQRLERRRELDAYVRQIRSGALTFDDLVAIAADSQHLVAEDFGYLLRNDSRPIQLLGRPFVDGVFAAEPAAVLGVLESRVALHIVRIDDKRPARVLSLDDPIMPGQNTTVRAEIRRAIANQRENELLVPAVEAVVTRLRAEAEVTIVTANLPW